MKRLLYYILVFLSFCLVSCDKQDDTYTQFVVPGGYNYPAKPAAVKTQSGYYRVALSWDIPRDPAVKSVKVFWDNRRNSMDVDYASAVDGRVTAVVSELEDRSYTFSIINYDASGNQSLATEVTVAPYGDGWLSTHAERKIVKAQMNGTEAEITMGSPMDEMVSTKFRYRDSKGNVVESKESLSCSDNVIGLPDAMKGKLVEYQSCYCPVNGIDTIWSGNWIKASRAIAYDFDGKKATATVTANQVRDQYLPDLIMDGIKDSPESRYYSTNVSSYRNVFPKIIVIDTKERDENAMTFNNFRFYQDPDPEGQTRRNVRSVYVYVSDQKFNPDNKNYVADFGEPVLKCNLTQTEAVQEFAPSEEKAGRYIAIVFRNSYSSSGYVDLWEFEAYGFVEANVD